MRRRDFLHLPAIAVMLTAPDACAAPKDLPGDHSRAVAAAQRVLPKLRAEMAKHDLAPGLPVLLRFFKEESEMEMWVQPAGAAEWKLFRSWKIARWSGKLGPKAVAGDCQTPEGFYHTDLASLNPRSNYHLAFNINYPNARDKSLGHTGSLIMVHGSNVSVGCFAMTNPAIEEIYTLVVMSLGAGQERVPIHCFPFRMTPKRMAKAARNDDQAAHLAFWRELEPAYNLFGQTHRLPDITAAGGKYVITAR